MSIVGLLWRTVRYLTARQVIYQLLHRLRAPARLSVPTSAPVTYFLPVPNPDKPIAWTKETFTFLNQSVQFPDDIDWNYPHLGRLWTYNLNYFNFLNQPGVHASEGLAMMHDFIRQTNSLRDGLEAYPTSLRILNWVQFLSRHQLRDEVVNRHLFAQVKLLNQRLEYHLSGNHLLENGFALLTGALFFRDERWFRKAPRLTQQELNSQVGIDGGHYERSLMYQQLLLDRLLDVVLTLQAEPGPDTIGLGHLCAHKAALMLGWLRAITFQNGDIPLVNDAACGIAPSTRQLQEKADRLLPQKDRFSITLADSGFRLLRQKRYALFASVGSPGPAHQPGHAHADTLSFVLYVDNHPLLVDSGTSTYQAGPRRSWERSTAAHNTVTVNEADSSEMWSTFRVGRRARAEILTDTDTRLTARHDGYRKLGVIHERTWLMEANTISITDRLLDVRTKNEVGQAGIARFYFHPTVSVQLLDEGVRAGAGLTLSFRSATKPNLSVKGYEGANGFNRLVPGYCLEVTFINSLHTTLRFTE